MRPILVAFIRHTGPYESILEPGSKLISLWESLFKWGTERGLVDNDSLLIGIPKEDPSVAPPEKQRFDVGLQVAEFREPVDNLAETYAHIYNTCIASGKYQLRPASLFEIYNHTQLSDDLHIHTTDVYLAVEPVRGTSED